MRNLLMTATALVAFSFSAQAEDLSLKDLNPYVGADIQHYSIEFNDAYDIGGGLALDGNTILEDGLSGLNLYVGIRPHKNFGVELGYFRTKEESTSIASGDTVGPGTVAAADFKTEIQLQGVTLDGMGYYPVGASERLELIGTAGLSLIKGEVKTTATGAQAVTVDETEIGLRLGAGAQYQITDRLNLRGLARYQKADFEDIADRAWVYSAGLNYAF